ncbi:ABC transporter substrate-binding protein [Bordetella genomosp. 4]|uniref:ABC transporter substrate-binding protein n=1 Tax=Bordetella genomosp. 4 TaxID=463044 RepID=A0A261TLA6_9BORD|nr:ABC transporter substrate-binding protein [Bordetella genomosp. 4]OZI42914.1 ABC transporter substrate-binding protein [Bordetella genomosp. 4]OZI50478.1 ABC transporter substrate-binding protein [Bordetella genomosp. 4]
MHKHNLHRRGFIKQAAGLAIAPALPLIPGMAHAASSNVVVGTWGGDYQNLLQQFISPIVKAQGVDVVFDTGNATARNTKLKAERNSRRGSMDIALLGDLDMYDASTAGVLEPVTADKIPNLANAIDTFKTPYSIPHIFSAMVLVYNKDLVKTPPRSFKDALDPQYKGRVGFSDILFNFNTLFVGLAEGGDGSSFEPGYAFLKKLKANSPKVFPSNEAVAAAFKSGEIWIACMWKARALQWKEAGLPLDFVIPEEGAIPVTFEAAVPKNSRNKDAAWKYMNALLDPAGQVHFADTMGYAPTVKNASLPPELQASVGFTKEELARIHPYDLKALASHRAASLDFWNKEFKAGL